MNETYTLTVFLELLECGHYSYLVLLEFSHSYTDWTDAIQWQVLLALSVIVFEVKIMLRQT